MQSTTSRVAVAGLVAALLLTPVLAAWMDQQFYLMLVSRLMILALAAAGLNLALGYGGMVSLGHALYMGVGVYAVGILAHHGIFSGWLQLAAALVASLLLSLVLGAVCLRTKGMAFIMITLAFAQMAFYVAVSLREYGGDDGMALPQRSDFGLFTLADPYVLYYAVLGALLLCLWLLHRLVHSRFGMVLRGFMSNPARMEAMGHPPMRYRLSGYVLSALVCTVAGFFLANLTAYVSPSYMRWQMSGELIVMVVLGGMGTVVGPVFGAAALVLIEEALASLHLGLPWGLDAFINDHLMVFVGVFVVVVALFLRRGLYGQLLARRAAARPDTPAVEGTR